MDRSQEGSDHRGIMREREGGHPPPHGDTRGHHPRGGHVGHPGYQDDYGRQYGHGYPPPPPPRRGAAPGPPAGGGGGGGRRGPPPPPPPPPPGGAPPPGGGGGGGGGGGR